MFSPQHNVQTPAVGTDPQVHVLLGVPTHDYPVPLRHCIPGADLRITCGRFKKKGGGKSEIIKHRLKARDRKKNEEGRMK